MIWDPFKPHTNIIGQIAGIQNIFSKTPGNEPLEIDVFIFLTFLYSIKIFMENWHFFLCCEYLIFVKIVISKSYSLLDLV